MYMNQGIKVIWKISHKFSIFHLTVSPRFILFEHNADDRNFFLNQYYNENKIKFITLRYLMSLNAFCHCMQEMKELGSKSTKFVEEFLCKKSLLINLLLINFVDVIIIILQIAFFFQQDLIEFVLKNDTSRELYCRSLFKV